MTNLPKHCTSIFRNSPRRTNFALMLLGALTIIAVPAAQAQTFTVLHTFTGGQDGGNPWAGLTMDGAGNLYGTARYGGSNGDGAVYQLKRAGSGWVFNSLYSFAGEPDGALPQNRVTFGPDGALYGPTAAGGTGSGCSGGCGTVFKLRPSPTACKSALCPWTETVLYRFTGHPDGAGASGDISFDPAGNIYGTTGNGGFYDQGTVYELMPSGSGWTESVLYSFFSENPSGGVILDKAGNLYGTTTSAAPVVYQLTYVEGSGWTRTVLYNLTSNSEPFAGLIFDRLGNLYGATAGGGSGGGTAFELSPSGGDWTYSLLWSFTNFSNDTVCGPWASLVMDAAGNLYGTTACDGGIGYGSVFKLTPSGGSWTYTSLHDFSGYNDGAHPTSNVVLDANGNLYGTTRSGGSQGYGVVWEITP